MYIVAVSSSQCPGVVGGGREEENKHNQLQSKEVVISLAVWVTSLPQTLPDTGTSYLALCHLNFSASVLKEGGVLLGNSAFNSVCLLIFLNIQGNIL